MQKYEKDVEFEQDEELAELAIHKRPDPPPQSIIAQELIKHKVVPSAKHANYILIGLSIVCLTAALIMFALYVEIPPYVPPHTPVVHPAQ
jgi:hypothetical protein